MTFDMTLAEKLLDGVIYFHLMLPLLLLLCAAWFPLAAGQLASYLGPLARAIDSFSRLTGHLVSWFALVMVLVMTLIVLLRYVFGLSFIWMQESITYLHALLFMLAAAYTLWVEGHVRVDVFYRTASEKRRALTDFLGTYFLLFPFMFLIIDTALPYVSFSWAVREGSKETSGIQAIFLLKSVILVFAYLMILQGISIAINRALLLTGFQGTDEHEPPLTGVQVQGQGDET